MPNEDDTIPETQDEPPIVLRGILKFITPWHDWVQRWQDSRMRPWHAPFFVFIADGGEAIVGPYLSERFEVRAEFLTYPSLKHAADELNFSADDFGRLADWMTAASKELALAKPAVDAYVLSADAYNAAPNDPTIRAAVSKGYERAALTAIQALLKEFRKLLPGGEPQLSDVAREHLLDRDIAISLGKAREVSMAGASMRAAGKPQCPPNECEPVPHNLALTVDPPTFRAICKKCGAVSTWPPQHAYDTAKVQTLADEHFEQLAEKHGHEIPKPPPVVIPVPDCPRPGCKNPADHYDAARKPACASCDPVITK